MEDMAINIDMPDAPEDKTSSIQHHKDQRESSQIVITGVSNTELTSRDQYIHEVLNQELPTKRTSGPSKHKNAKRPMTESKMRNIAMGMQKKLGERKLSLLMQVLRCAGVDIAQRVLKETLQVEKDGGLETQDGKRRSAGGSYFTLLKQHVRPDVYKEIYAIEKQIKNKSKARKRKLARPQPMDIDEQDSGGMNDPPTVPIVDDTNPRFQSRFQDRDSD